MLGDGSCRVLLFLCGYLFPAYSCYKAIEQKNVDTIRQWCIYWLMLALFTTAERLVLDWLVFWVPLYYEGKLLFVLYLWHPQTRGALALYDRVLQPFVTQHEGIIDQTLEESKTWCADFVTAHFHRLISFVQSKAHLAIGLLKDLKHEQAENGRPTRVGSAGRSRSPIKDTHSNGLKSFQLPKDD